MWWPQLAHGRQLARFLDKKSATHSPEQGMARGEFDWRNKETCHRYRMLGHPSLRHMPISEMCSHWRWLCKEVTVTLYGIMPNARERRLVIRGRRERRLCRDGVARVG